MKKHLLLFYFLIIISSKVFSQSYFYCIGDSVHLGLASYTGDLQWQQSSDSITWSNITGANYQPYGFVFSNSMYYRAKVTVPNCNPVYSPVLKAVISTNCSGQYPPGTVHCSGTPTIIVDVTNPITGKTWMDRNLGASRVATSLNDTSAYGDLYQWGRGADGHQCRNSDTSKTLSSSDIPNNAYFICWGSDWRNPQNNNLWQGKNGVNNPCPNGYRLPTKAELEEERVTWSNNYISGAFASPLKFVAGGYRDNNYSTISFTGTRGHYWASTFTSGGAIYTSYYLTVGDINSFVNAESRNLGFSIRCIKADSTENSGIGTVATIDCANAVQSGDAFVGGMPNIDVSIAYTGGNGGAYLGETIQSTGVTGLAARLTEGYFNNGNGTLTYQIMGGSASSVGTANFAITIGGQSCSFSVQVYPEQPMYPSGSVFCNGSATIVNDVTNPVTGRTWMDRNLGASRAAQSSTDSLAYGDLYQWGRFSDGHQCRNSSTTTTLSSTDQPGHGDFIIGGWDWISPNNNSLWQGISGINNPCPSGYRIPTSPEFDVEVLSWISNDYIGAMSSNLKLPVVGFRGMINNISNEGDYWSSTVIGGLAWSLIFGNDTSATLNGGRSSGYAVRCIKDESLTNPGLGSISSINCSIPTLSGLLIVGNSTNNVTCTITYSGGNGGIYESQAIYSRGVLGLTANLTSGNFQNGDGVLTLNITGTPDRLGQAFFPINFAGISCYFELTVNESLPLGSINSIDCNTPTNNGTLVQGVEAINVSSKLAYTGGNGGAHNGQTVNSTGINGLTATLAAGNFKTGDSTLTYMISGTPDAIGTANFAINIGGQSCTLNLNVYDSSLVNKYPAGSVFCASGPTQIVDVTNPVTGRIWMDRNLGASRTAQSIIDSLAYGDLYQWGRFSDGHQCRNSDTTSTLSSSDQPGHGKFILAPNTPNDWRNPQNDNLWQGINGINNPCPSGYRIPTETELNNERLSWGQPPINNSCGAFSSPLKLSLAGGRDVSSGLFEIRNSIGDYWSSSINNGKPIYLDFNIVAPGCGINSYYNRGQGKTVRCIKDEPQTQGSINTIDCNTPTNTGTLVQGVAANNVSSTLAYTGGNGGAHNGQTVNSTGVNGLTATLAAGNFNNGDSTLTYMISGTPDNYGTASFAINIGGQTCTLNLTVNDSGSIFNPNLTYGSVNDIDGNTYKTIVIGSQTWMAENLRTTKYSNGDLIPNVTDSAQWVNLISSAWVHYNNDPQNEIPFGKLYNFYAASDSRNICPGGWHLPNDIEWDTLTFFLDPSSRNNGASSSKPAALKLISTGSRYWQAPNTGATNESGFSALPGGEASGVFSYLGQYSNYWSSTNKHFRPIFNCLNNSNCDPIIYNYWVPNVPYGFSIRCIKDEPQSQGSINTIDCNTPTNTGTLVQGIAANNVSTTINYTGGNGGTYEGQTVNSSGVTGLTATLTAGNFKNGDSTLTYSINGTPNNYGTASFVINIGGQSCILSLLVYPEQPIYPLGSVFCNGTATLVYDVTNPITGKIWMDRNLGASRVATNYADDQGYGDLYQWGRSADGHQCRNSSTTTILSSSDQPGHSDFILTTNTNSWLNFQNNNLWQGLNGINNPCPLGYRVPTQAEYDMEISNWLPVSDSLGFKSPLKLPLAGFRYPYVNSQITLSSLGGYGEYWTSTIANNLNNFSYNLYFMVDYADVNSNMHGRDFGFSVRCIKGETSIQGVINTIDCNNPANSGTLIQGTTASNVNTTLSYTGGNGGIFSRQIINSNGVTGLTATIGAGYFNNGNGTLTFTITGTPSDAGNANFDFSIGGQTCSFNLTVLDSIFNSSLTYGSVFDIDGNAYKTIQIGNQTWMAQNLKTTRYQNGDFIQNESSSGQWQNLTTGAWTHYNDNYQNENPYGKLYNWYAVNDSRNICPTGWHIPSDVEWTTLTNYLGGENIAGGKLKSIGTQFWQNTNTDATNESGFSGLPGGSVIGSTSMVPAMGSYGNWWSSTEFNAEYSWFVRLSRDNGNLLKLNDGYPKFDGLSVRCLMDEVSSQGSINTIDCNTPIINDILRERIAANSVSATLSYTGGNGGAHNGQTVTSTGVNGLTATLAADTFVIGNGTLTYNITGTPDTSGMANFAINIGGQSCNLVLFVEDISNDSIFNPNISYGTLNDVDGNSYKTVQFAGQTWLAENLRTTKYRNGDPIENVTNASTWYNSTTGAWAYYNNEANNDYPYGKLYNWYAAADARGICPDGWHLPAEWEWRVASQFFGNDSISGGKLKSYSTRFWSAPNASATNLSGFSGLPGGRLFYYVGFNNKNNNAYWWTSMEGSTAIAARTTQLNYSSSNLVFAEDYKQSGSSVRCINDITTGFIDGLDCELKTDSGSLTIGVPASGVSSLIYYAWGNGGAHNGQTVSSTGVSGLTATLEPDNFAPGLPGGLKYRITGTPADTGMANFNINIGGRSCTFSRRVRLQTAAVQFLFCDTIAGATRVADTAFWDLNNPIQNSGKSVSRTIAYHGGNGGYYDTDTINSRGVTGLKAILPEGILANGYGSLTFNISGMPNKAGNAYFDVNLGGSTCTFKLLIDRVLDSIFNPALTYGTVWDNEGNQYKTIEIWGQTWMAENLKSTRYRNYDQIQNLSDANQWSNATEGAWVHYNNDAENEYPYGKLYNAYTVNDSRQICPEGWHVPTGSEMSAIINHFSGENNYVWPSNNANLAGKKLKSASNTVWTGLRNTNETGFSGLPGGYRTALGGFFNNFSQWGHWWIKQQSVNINDIYALSLRNNDTSAFLNTYPEWRAGKSVRCIKDIIVGYIDGLDCVNPIDSGMLYTGVANNVSSTLLYHVGNMGSHNGQVVSSTGVTGLTATLLPDTFNGVFLRYEITGTPTSIGVASFAINIGGQTCTLNRTVTLPPGVITSLDCLNSTNSGTLVQGVAANNVSTTINYTGGNGGTYEGQTVNSTGVNGLTATLAAGNFNNSDSTLTYSISGTPDNIGTASFAINIGGQSCTLTVSVVTLVSLYPAGSVFCNGPTAILDVTNPVTGKTWMDRNLGASQAATSSTDAASYGDLYQWGRGSDGHQCRNSSTTTTLSSTDQPGHGDFILINSGNFDWRNPQNNNLWQGVNGINNPCPSGYRLPTRTEFESELATWISNDAFGALTSLGLTMAGGRINDDGSLFYVGSFGAYWYSSVSANNGIKSSGLGFNYSSSYPNDNNRSIGRSVRCIKD